MTHDVIVVGAGPAGCRTAHLLAQEGFDVLLLEEHSSPGEQIICSGIIGQEAFELMPLPEESILHPLKDIRFFSPTAKEFFYRPDQCLASIVCRRKFDTGLARMAIEAGARLSVNSRVEALSVGPDGVKLSVRKDGRVDSLKARQVVLATGFGSSLLVKAGFSDPLPTVQAAQVELPIDALAETEVYTGHEVAPGGFGWAIPIGDGNARVGITCDQQAPFYLRRLLKRPLLSNRLGGSLIRIQSCPIPIGVRDSSVRDRLMIVGEASGQVKTTTNGGIYYGLLCAGLAAETLTDALRQDNLREERLQSYDRRWRERLGQELQAGMLLRQFYNELSNHQIDLLFDLARVEMISSLIRKKVRFDWHRPLIQSVLEQGFIRNLINSVLGLPLLDNPSTP
jgi:digeranylgeranylglycerophospholipid reductase